MEKRKAGLLTLLILVRPGLAYANPNPPFAVQNMHWVLIGELVVVYIEAALLVRFFGLTRPAALRMSAWANLFSFFLGLLCSVFLLFYAAFPFLPHELMDQLSELHFSAEARTPAAIESLIFTFFAEMTVLTILTLAVESPLYSKLLRKAGVEISGAKLLKVALVNLISYPLFYTVLFGAAMIKGVYMK